MGIPHRISDLLDERPFTRAELHDFYFLLFGKGSFYGVPEPEQDLTASLQALDKIPTREQDPVKKQMKPILNLKDMHRIYGEFIVYNHVRQVLNSMILLKKSKIVTCLFVIKHFNWCQFTHDQFIYPSISSILLSIGVIFRVPYTDIIETG